MKYLLSLLLLTSVAAAEEKSWQKTPDGKIVAVVPQQVTWSEDEIKAQLKDLKQRLDEVDDKAKEAKEQLKKAIAEREEMLEALK